MNSNKNHNIKKNICINNRNYIKYFILIVLFFLSFCTFAQNINKINMPDKSKYYNYGSNLYTDIYVVPNANLDSLNFYFFYKIYFNELVFKLNSNNKYFTILNIEAIFKDKNGITRKRIITKDTINVDTYNETISQTLNFTNLVNFTLLNDDYDVKISLLNGKTSYLNSNITKNIEKYSKLKENNNILLEPYFLCNNFNTTQSNTYTPFISNGKIPFSENTFSIVIPFLYNNLENPQFKYSISSKKNDERRKVWGTFNTITGEAQTLYNSILKFKYDIHQHKFATPEISIIETHLNNQNKIGLLKITPNYNNFSPGLYELEIINISTNEKEVFPFEIIWLNIPLSLLDVNYAIKSMQYILNADEENKINSGSAEEKYNKLINYWNTKYPSKTLYNHTMTTYFQRVDYAFFNYQTIVEKDGTKTARGNVYILNGKPDKIETDMKNKNSYEIWYYKRINKKYIFNIISIGNYKLEKIEDIEKNIKNIK